MPSPQGSLPIQTPETLETDQPQPDKMPGMELYGFAGRMRELTAADHATEPTRESTGARRAKAVALLASVGMLVPGGTAVANETSNADVEKAALAANKDAQTKSIDSFPAPEAQTSARRGMQPAGVMKGIRRVLAVAHSSPSYGVPNTRLARLTTKASLLKGRCKPSDGWLSKNIATRKGRTFNTYCNGKNNGGTKLVSPTEYSRGLNRLGNKVVNRVARLTRLPVENHGDTQKAVATQRRAVIRFAKDNTSVEDRQLRVLILRIGKRPQPRWYPAATTENQ